MSGALRTEIMKKLFELEKTPAPSVEVQIWHIDRLIFYAAARLLGELAVPFYSRFRAFEEPPGASRDSWRSLRPCRRDVLRQPD